MMRSVSILSRNITAEIRDGVNEKYPLSVLRFKCVSEVAKKIEENPNWNMEFNAFEIKVVPYNGEVPFTLQSDAEILINRITNKIKIK